MSEDTQAIEDVFDVSSGFDLDQVEAEASSGSGGNVLKGKFEVGFLAYVSRKENGLTHDDVWFDIKKYGKEGAIKAEELEKKYDAHNDQFEKVPLLALVLDGNSILGGDLKEEWGDGSGIRWSEYPMRPAGTREQESAGYEPRTYEVLRQSVRDIQETENLENESSVLGTWRYMRVVYIPDPWELWQIHRAQEGEWTPTKYKSMSEDEVNFVPRILRVFTSEEEAMAETGTSIKNKIPEEPTGWQDDWGSWNGYFTNVVNAAIDDADLSVFLLEHEGQEIVTQSHLDEAVKMANNTPEEEKIPF
jgi:hypothetical protein